MDNNELSTQSLLRAEQGLGDPNVTTTSSSSTGGALKAVEVPLAHNHSHQHSEHKNCCGPQVEMKTMKIEGPSIDDLVDSSIEDIVTSMSTLLRFGRYEAMTPLMEKLVEKKADEIPTILSKMDDGGHSVLHWAAKRVDDIRFLQSLIDMVKEYKLHSLLNVPSKDNVGMAPLHWACTESSIPHVALLMKNGADVEAKDASGCTPLLIASQYGQVEVVAYLLKNGANIQAVDSSRDTALHWAAYKGSIQVCGLLAFYDTLTFATQDAYGQTPLHLAALRGHTSVVRYILQHLTSKKAKEILFLPDKNERNPLDLAIHKKRPNVAAVLKEAMAKAEDPRGHFLRKTLLTNVMEMFSLKAWKQWFGMSAGMDEYGEPSKFPFYFMIMNYVFHFVIMFTAFAPILNAEKGLMWDKSGWLLWNLIWMIATWYFFWKTWKTSPGYVDETHPQIDFWRRRYEETLEAYAETTTDPAESKRRMESLPPLDHTCHVARPPRSKHCRVKHKCTLMFDHFCPFVDNTVGLYNYKYFYLFLLSIFMGVFSFVITLFIYVRRYRAEFGSMPTVTLIVGLEICLCLFPVAGLLLYHTQLTGMNLTTNEHINLRKYKYFFRVLNGKKQYVNPWSKGFVGNFMDRMNPSDRSYMMPAEFQPLTTGVENV